MSDPVRILQLFALAYAEAGTQAVLEKALPPEFEYLAKLKSLLPPEDLTRKLTQLTLQERLQLATACNILRNGIKDVDKIDV